MLTTILGSVVVTALVVGGGLWLLNRRAGQSIFHWGRTKAGQVGEAFEGYDAVGQMKQAAQDAADELATADEALIAAETLRGQLKDQIDFETKELNRLRGKIKKKLDGGTPETDKSIIQMAKQVRTLEESIGSTQEQYNTQGDVYAGLLKSANSAATKISGAMQEAQRLQVELDVSEGNKKVAGMVAKYNPAAVNSRLANIDKYRQIAKRQIKGNNASIKVMADRGQLNGDDDDEDAEDVSDVLARIRSGGGPKVTTPGAAQTQGS